MSYSKKKKKKLKMGPNYARCFSLALTFTGRVFDFRLTGSTDLQSPFSLSLSVFCFNQLKLFHNNPLIPFILMRKLLCTIQVYISYLQELLSPH